MSRILVIDDDESFRSFLVALCLKRDHDVVEAINGSHAETILASQTFDLVISDLMMPYKDGLEVIRDIKCGGDIPVILLTGHFHSNAGIYIRAAISFGAATVLPKTCDPRDLLSHIDQQLAA